MHRPWTRNKLSALLRQGRIVRRAIGRIGVATCILLALVGAAPADDDLALDQFLSRLGLAELRLTHMERMLAREHAAGKRAALARSLADAYAEELIAAADEPERFAKLKNHAEKLLAAFPDARTAAASVALLQADYQRAEALMIRWLEDRSDKAPLDEAANILNRTQPELTARQTELAAAADRAADAIDNIKS